MKEALVQGGTARHSGGLQARSGSLSLPPLSLYVHLPWCTRKCPYCDFNSYAARPSSAMQEDYVCALSADLEQSLPPPGEREIISIFIGGGTPSLFAPEHIAHLLSEFAARLKLAENVEISLEANPGSAEAEHFSAYRAAGVNRLSLGIQSLQNEKLLALGRVHNRDEALAASRHARQAGFDNLNMDLMFGLPDQTPEQALQDLSEVLAEQPAQLSWYQLSLEPNTVFYSHPPVLPDEEAIHRMQQAGGALLREHGYQQYEISAWARPGRQCVHNRNYWEFGDYLGIGAGAHSKLTDGAGCITRTTRHRVPTSWQTRTLRGEAVSSRRVLQQTELPVEFFMNALRLCDGVPASHFSARTGLSLQDIAEPLDRARQRGLLRHQTDTLAATRRGYQYLNDLLQIFM